MTFTQPSDIDRISYIISLNFVSYFISTAGGGGGGGQGGLVSERLTLKTTITSAQINFILVFHKPDCY